MKLIESYKSPNFNERKSLKKLNYIILHYTAMTTCQEALEHMCDNKSRVSAHFLVSKKGEIYSLVDLQKRAWHAGQSYWRGLTDLNSNSIGIEIDNSGHHNNNEEYAYLQIESLIELIHKLTRKFNIISHNILGHSDIAPFRKIDPGEKFPWNELNKKKLSYLPKINQKKINYNLKLNDNNNKQNKDVLKMLGEIGYNTSGIKISDERFKLLILTYQRHYRQTNISGEIDIQTINLIRMHYKDMLTSKLNLIN